MVGTCDDLYKPSFALPRLPTPFATSPNLYLALCTGRIAFNQHFNIVKNVIDGDVCHLCFNQSFSGIKVALSLIYQLSQVLGISLISSISVTFSFYASHKKEKMRTERKEVWLCQTLPDCQRLHPICLCMQYIIRYSSRIPKNYSACPATTCQFSDCLVS